MPATEDTMAKATETPTVGGNAGSFEAADDE